jgi:hypothetical protein
MQNDFKRNKKIIIPKGGINVIKFACYFINIVRLFQTSHPPSSTWKLWCYIPHIAKSIMSRIGNTYVHFLTHVLALIKSTTIKMFASWLNWKKFTTFWNILLFSKRFCDFSTSIQNDLYGQIWFIEAILGCNDCLIFIMAMVT